MAKKLTQKVVDKFSDGLANIQNNITNKRNVLNTNKFVHTHLVDSDLRAIYKSGIGSKIVRIKSGYSLNDTIQFKTNGDEKYYNKYLRKEVKRACRFMIGFGRGIIVNYYHGDDLSKPLRVDSTRRLKCRAFSGDEVSVSDIMRDFHHDRYNKPVTYMVNGHAIHHTRVVDFVYVEPPEDDLTQYNYGGVSEFEMIYNQLIADGIVERSSANIVEKNSSLFYKIAGFKQALQAKDDSAMVEYYRLVEDFRSMMGATLMDKEDEVKVESQNLANLKDVSDLTLRRLAMVTGIPLSFLVGENVKGLNSTGDNERLIFQDMIETIQSEYMIEPLQELFGVHGLGDADFKENQGDSPQARIAYDKQVVDIAFLLYQMGEDYGAYLSDHDVIKSDNYDQFFKEDETD